MRSEVGHAEKDENNEKSSPILNAFGEAKVGDLHVPILIQQKVLWLQITINDVHLVEVVKSKNNLSSVEFRHLVSEAACPPKVREKLTTNNVLHEHVQASLILESTVPAFMQKDKSKHI